MAIARFGDWVDDISIQNVSTQIIQDKYPIPEDIIVQDVHYELRKLNSKSNIMYRLGRFCKRRSIEEFRTYGVIDLDYRGDLLGYKNVHNVDGVKVITKSQGTQFAQSMYIHFVQNSGMTILGDEEQFFEQGNSGVD
jgi:dUTPase